MNSQQNHNMNMKPKQWKLMLIEFLFVYIFVNTIFFLFGDVLSELPLLMRTFILAGVFVPTFGKVIPALQRRFYKWTVF